MWPLHLGSYFIQQALTDEDAEEGRVYAEQYVVEYETDKTRQNSSEDGRYIVDNKSICPGSVGQPASTKSTKCVENTEDWEYHTSRRRFDMKLFDGLLIDVHERRVQT